MPGEGTDSIRIDRPLLDTVLLDVDGTLIDSTYQHALAWQRAFAEHELQIPMWRLHRAIGMGGDRLVGRTQDWLEEGVRAVLLRSERSICVGDSTYDVEAAAAAGWECIGVRTGGFGIAELHDVGAASVFDDVAELLDRIDDTPLGCPRSG